jgi:outer membrane protein assembly factor BamE
MRAFLIPLLGATLLGGCALSRQSTDDFLGLITPYRIDIVQGNVVTKEQLAQLRPGMSRNQVRDVLGTPLLTDPFHRPFPRQPLGLHLHDPPSRHAAAASQRGGDVRR